MKFIPGKQEWFKNHFLKINVFHQKKRINRITYVSIHMLTYNMFYIIYNMLHQNIK